MKFTPISLEGSYIVDLDIFSDERGWFGRYFCKNEFQQIGHTKEWVQMNHSFTTKKGTVRGMHFQVQPYREIKMVRVVAGAIYDVIVDLRKDSPTFLQWYGADLSAENKRMLYIPEGFAHGFQALTDNVEMLYHHSMIYTKEAEAGVRYNDPALSIQWPLPIGIVSARDMSHPYIDANFKGV